MVIKKNVVTSPWTAVAAGNRVHCTLPVNHFPFPLSRLMLQTWITKRGNMYFGICLVVLFIGLFPHIGCYNAETKIP